MNPIIASFTTVIIPLLALVVPGIAIIPLYQDLARPAKLARIILWSFASLIVTTLAAALTGISSWYIILLSVLLVAIITWQYRSRLLIPSVWRTLIAITAIVVLLYTLFAIPLFKLHHGLPTGDIQKTIIWAEQINTTRHLPDYQRAITDLNRDPVDFYTPGLHTLTALIMQSTGQPLIAVSLFSITVVLAVAVIAYTLAQFMALPHSRSYLPVVTIILLLTNFRFLRYLREPGYHFQNSVGELLLFGCLLVGLSLVQRWRWPDAILLALLLISLAASHQFSAFIAMFALSPIIGLLVLRAARTYVATRTHIVWIVAAILTVLVVGLRLNLQAKIPHIFTSTPHLALLTPSLIDYFRLLGPTWFTLGFMGLITALMSIWRKPRLSTEVILFITSTLILLVLSQGPSLFIDIPPVRALLYSAVPLSICGAYFIVTTLTRLWRTSPRPLAAAIILLLALITGGAISSSVVSAYALNHHLRTNSTLTREQLGLITNLEAQSAGAVLIDDYNRRSTSWLVLSDRPMYTRIAADLERQMSEANQSPLRYQLYINQLNYEKVFSLGSLPAAAALMREHAINYVTGIVSTSDLAFAHNPALLPISQADGITLYAANSTPTRLCQQTNPLAPDTLQWLLRTSTLVNDIGDREDTFEHLPISLRSTQLSEPQHNGSCTWRSTTASLIPVRFNIGDYVQILWDQEKTNQPDIDLELFIHFADKLTSPLRIQTTTGQFFTIDQQQTTIHLPAQEIFIDDKGFITLFLHNPNQHLVSLDLIALGLARIP